MGSIMRDLKQRRKKITALLGIAVIALFALAACGAPGQPDATTSSAANVDSSALAADFPITVYQGGDALGGEEIQFSEVLAQGKPVVLNFWAGLCPPCRLEMPDLQAVHEQYQDDIILIGLDVGTFTGLGNRADAEALLQELNVSYPTGTTPNGEVMQAYQVIGMPSTYFITPKGEIVETWSGLLNEQKLGELVEKLIEASG